MPTTKTRINITLPETTEHVLAELAKRDSVPVATKAVQLIHMAIETDEDGVLDRIASERDTKKTTFIPFAKAWK